MYSVSDKIEIIQSSKDLILVVDDDPDMLLLISRYLEPNGFSFVTADSPAEAFSILKANKIALTLLDWFLTKALGQPNGADVIRACREKDQWMPVYVMSNVPV